MRKWQEYLDSGGASSQSQADDKSATTSATTGASGVETESSKTTTNSNEEDTGSNANENDKHVEISGDSSVADQKSARLHIDLQGDYWLHPLDTGQICGTRLAPVSPERSSRDR